MKGMTLTKEKVEKNAIKFNVTGEKYGFINEKLIELLGIEFFKAPATSETKLFNAFEGGLVSHILNVTKYAVRINALLPEAKRADVNSLVTVSCLHQIGKNVMFERNDSDWHIERGIMYNWDDSQYDFSVTERTLYYIMKSGIELSEDEFYAICNYNEDFSKKPMNREGYKLASVLKTANMVAQIEEK